MAQQNLSELVKGMTTERGDMPATGTTSASTDQYDPKGHARSIRIEQVDHGYIVDVGCQRIVIESAGKLIGLLSEYLQNPNQTERKYLSGNLI